MNDKFHTKHMSVCCCVFIWNFDCFIHTEHTTSK